MTYRVGIDLVDIAEVGAALEQHGVAYLQHVYTTQEQQACASTTGAPSPALLAQRFAAKEAVRKVVRADLRWNEIDASEPPRVRVPDAGWTLLVAMTQASGHAAAVVIGEPS